MRALVTGASGFVGSTLSEELCRQGHDVKVLVRPTSSRDNLGATKVRTVTGDLRDAASLVAAVTDVDVIYHVAGVISAPTREGYFAANQTGTANLARAALEHCPDLKRFVYVSSLAAGGPASATRPREESDAPNPVSLYGASKLAGEVELQKISDSFPAVILRPPVVYGPRDRGMFTFFKLTSRGLCPSLGGRSPGEGGYSFVHVADLVQALVSLGEHAGELSPHEVFYVAGDEVLTWDDTMRLMASAAGRKGVRVPLPLPILATAGHVMGALGKLGIATPLNADKTKEIRVKYWTCRNDKLKKAIGFKPQWSLERGFRQTLDWYRERAWL